MTLDWNGMVCPECGKRAIRAELEAQLRPLVHDIEGGAVWVRVDFDGAEWTVDDVYCDECGWTPDNSEVTDYEVVG